MKPDFMHRFQLLAKPAPRLGQLRTRGAFLDTQRLRHFGMRIPFDSDQVKNDPISFGQSADEFQQFRFRQRGDGIGIDGRIGENFVAGSFHIETLFLIRPQSGIDHNAPNPALKRTLEMKLIQFGKYLHKTLLQNIRCIRLRTRIAQAYSVHFAGKTLVQKPLMLRRPAQTTVDDVSFVQLRGLFCGKGKPVPGRKLAEGNRFLADAAKRVFAARGYKDFRYPIT